MCDMSSVGSTIGTAAKNFADPSTLPAWQRALIATGKGAMAGYSQNQAMRSGQPMQPMMPKPNQSPWWKSNRKTSGAPASSSPTGQPNSTQAPQGSSTNDDIPNQMPGFGYRPQSGGFGDEDFLKKYFSGGSMMGGGQGFNT